MGTAARTEALGKWHTRRKLRNISIPFAFCVRAALPKKVYSSVPLLARPGAP